MKGVYEDRGKREAFWGILGTASVREIVLQNFIFSFASRAFDPYSTHA
jgi:hypothetical protein